MKTLSFALGLFVCLAAFGQDGSWKIEERSLPISESFEAGTKVVFFIDYELHSVVNYTNLSDASSKIIFHVAENGTPLPDEKIGPVKYRTTELDAGEKKEMTFNWENGQEVTIEVHEGKVQIEIHPKKRPI